MGTGVRGDDAQTDGNAGMACRTDCSGLRGSPLAWTDREMASPRRQLRNQQPTL